MRLNVTRIFIVLVLLVVTIGGQRPPSAVASDDAQPRYALLVGITNYKSPSLNKIDGCENNVPLLAETLTGLYGFKKENVLTLVDGQATKAGIIDIFRSHLIANARRAKVQGNGNAVIVYYFCGHGSQYADQDKDENDGLDETFVAWDSRTGSTPDILDDEIDDLKAELRPFTHNTTLIFESCHSGTGSRGDGDTEYISEEADIDLKKYPAYKRRYPPTSEKDAETYVEIAASASTNTAKSESKEHCNCDKPYSLMTKALVEALNRASYRTTYRGLVREVAYAVGQRSQQDPQVEGDRDVPLFRGAAKRARPYIEIASLLDGDRIKIKAGRIHGLKEGSQVAVYSRDSDDDAGDKGWLTNGIVKDVRDFESIVQLPLASEEPNVKKVEIASHVVLTSPVFGGGPVLVTLDDAVAAEIIATLNEHRLIENGMVSIVRPQQITPSAVREARGVLRLRKSKFADAFPPRIRPLARLPKPRKCTESEGKVIPEKLTPVTAATEVYYLDDGTSGGTPLYGKLFAPGPAAAGEIASTIRSYALRTNLLSIDNDASTLQNAISAEIKILAGIETIEVCRDGELRTAPKSGLNLNNFQLVDGAKKEIPIGSAFYFEIANRSGEIRRRTDRFASGEALYVTALILRNNGDIGLAYQSPNRDPLGDGMPPKRIGASLASSPGGPEQLIVIVSRKYVDFGFYETEATARSSQSILEQILKQSGVRSRDGDTLIPDEPNSWGVFRLDLNIVSQTKAMAKK